MKIPENVIRYTYKESKRVFENNLSFKEAAENIHKNCNLKITSALDYPYYFKYLITGSGSCRILSSYTQEFYLNSIFKDYGKEQLAKSLIAFMTLIVKFEAGKEGSKKSMRAIYQKYSKLI